ncbi:tRNA s(4)U8 sulfurtransferase [Pasteurella multocida subsp. multocida str. Anand1_cattle]|nr:tRNA s(4)U8 sulfurtransferase [Pasteurella multocida subsp. multocida str. Anand1_cattle]
MKFVIKLFPEIMIKSESVRKRFVKILTGNIRNILTKHDETIAVVRHWELHRSSFEKRRKSTALN